MAVRLRFITKKRRNGAVSSLLTPPMFGNPDSLLRDEPEEEAQPESTPAKRKNKTKKENKEDMMDIDKLKEIEATAAELADNNIKIVKKDRGLIERTESSKIVLTEDNRQVLND